MADPKVSGTAPAFPATDTNYNDIAEMKNSTRGDNPTGMATVADDLYEKQELPNGSVVWVPKDRAEIKHAASDRAAIDEGVIRVINYDGEAMDFFSDENYYLVDDYKGVRDIMERDPSKVKEQTWKGHSWYRARDQLGRVKEDEYGRPIYALPISPDTSGSDQDSWGSWFPDDLNYKVTGDKIEVALNVEGNLRAWVPLDRDKVGHEAYDKLKAYLAQERGGSSTGDGARIKSYYDALIPQYYLKRAEIAKFVAMSAMLTTVKDQLAAQIGTGTGEVILNFNDFAGSINSLSKDDFMEALKKSGWLPMDESKDPPEPAYKMDKGSCTITFANADSANMALEKILKGEITIDYTDAVAGIGDGATDEDAMVAMIRFGWFQDALNVDVKGHKVTYADKEKAQTSLDKVFRRPSQVAEKGMKFDDPLSISYYMYGQGTASTSDDVYLRAGLAWGMREAVKDHSETQIVSFGEVNGIEDLKKTETVNGNPTRVKLEYGTLTAEAKRMLDSPSIDPETFQYFTFINEGGVTKLVRLTKPDGSLVLAPEDLEAPLDLGSQKAAEMEKIQAALDLPRTLGTLGDGTLAALPTDDYLFEAVSSNGETLLVVRVPWYNKLSETGQIIISSSIENAPTQLEDLDGDLASVHFTMEEMLALNTYTTFVGTPAGAQSPDQKIVFFSRNPQAAEEQIYNPLTKEVDTAYAYRTSMPRTQIDDIVIPMIRELKTSGYPIEFDDDAGPEEIMAAAYELFTTKSADFGWWYPGYDSAVPFGINDVYYEFDDPKAWADPRGETEPVLNPDDSPKMQPALNEDGTAKMKPVMNGDGSPKMTKGPDGNDIPVLEPVMEAVTRPKTIAFGNTRLTRRRAAFLVMTFLRYADDTTNYGMTPAQARDYMFHEQFIQGLVLTGIGLAGSAVITGGISVWSIRYSMKKQREIMKDMQSQGFSNEDDVKILEALRNNPDFVPDFLSPLYDPEKNKGIKPYKATEEREAKMRAVMKALANNEPVMLLGESAQGKTAMMIEIAKRLSMATPENAEALGVPKELIGKKIMTLDWDVLEAGTKFVGQYAEKVKTLKLWLEAHPEYVVFMDEFHKAIGHGETGLDKGHGGNDFLQKFKELWGEKKFPSVVSTTLAEYQQHFKDSGYDKSGALERRFKTITLDTYDKDEVKEMMSSLAIEYLEKYMLISVSKEQVDAIIDTIYDSLPSDQKNLLMDKTRQFLQDMAKHIVETKVAKFDPNARPGDFANIDPAVWTTYVFGRSNILSDMDGIKGQIAELEELQHSKGFWDKVKKGGQRAWNAVRRKHKKLVAELEAKKKELDDIENKILKLCAPPGLKEHYLEQFSLNQFTIDNIEGILAAANDPATRDPQGKKDRIEALEADIQKLLTERDQLLRDATDIANENGDDPRLADFERQIRAKSLEISQKADEIRAIHKSNLTPAQKRKYEAMLVKYKKERSRILKKLSLISGLPVPDMEQKDKDKAQRDLLAFVQVAQAAADKPFSGYQVRDKDVEEFIASNPAWKAVSSEGAAEAASSATKQFNAEGEKSRGAILSAVSSAWIANQSPADKLGAGFFAALGFSTYTRMTDAGRMEVVISFVNQASKEQKIGALGYIDLALKQRPDETNGAYLERLKKIQDEIAKPDGLAKLAALLGYEKPKVSLDEFTKPLLASTEGRSVLSSWGVDAAALDAADPMASVLAQIRASSDHVLSHPAAYRVVLEAGIIEQKISVAKYAELIPLKDAILKALTAQRLAESAQNSGAAEFDKLDIADLIAKAKVDGTLPALTPSQEALLSTLCETSDNSARASIIDRDVVATLSKLKMTDAAASKAGRVFLYKRQAGETATDYKARILSFGAMVGVISSEVTASGKPTAEKQVEFEKRMDEAVYVNLLKHFKTPDAVIAALPDGSPVKALAETKRTAASSMGVTGSAINTELGTKLSAYQAIVATDTAALQTARIEILAFISSNVADSNLCALLDQQASVIKIHVQAQYTEVPLPDIEKLQVEIMMATARCLSEIRGRGEDEGLLAARVKVAHERIIKRTTAEWDARAEALEARVQSDADFLSGTSGALQTTTSSHRRH